MAKIGKSFASRFFVYRLDLMVNESRQCVNQMNIEQGIRNDQWKSEIQITKFEKPSWSCFHFDIHRIPLNSKLVFKLKAFRSR